MLRMLLIRWYGEWTVLGRNQAMKMMLGVVPEREEEEGVTA